MSGLDNTKNVLIFMRLLISGLIGAHGWHRLIFADPAFSGPADLGGAITDFGFPAGLALGWLITWVEAFGAQLFAMGRLIFPLGMFCVRGTILNSICLTELFYIVWH